ncbi:MAG: type 1 glutamine amidotransferase [Spirochaetaceae bacterium]|nr:MAG: type 1 glutamine amidotransferase [Spirochaetaceae bacterium]
MRAHCLLHVPFEGLGSIEPWLKNNGYDISYTRFYESHQLPDVNSVDLLIIMGGPMSVNDEAEYPWLIQEKLFVRKCIDAGKPVLGICLGAQMIASAMGQSVYPGSYKEIGWLPVSSVSDDQRLGAAFPVYSFPDTFTAFHWHGETFDLPAKAIRLASTQACLNQAFQLGERVIGLQFHLETTMGSAAAIVSACRDELVPDEFVQTEKQILAAPEECYLSAKSIMYEILAFLTA